MTRITLALPSALALSFLVISVSTAVVAGPAVSTWFQRSLDQDVFGYFLPKQPIGSGDYVLRSLSLGDLTEFEAFEAGENEIEGYAPIMMEFDDASSPEQTNELGQTYYEKSVRALPSAYRLTRHAIAFSSTTEDLGAVTFEGKIDLAALEQAMNDRSEKVVITGDLSFAGKLFQDVQFVYFGGD